MAATEFTTAGGKVLKLAPFVLNATRFCLPKIRTLQTPTPEDTATDLKIEVIVEALRRQNEEITKEWCGENLQTQELDAVLLAILDVSGLKGRGEPQPGEAQSP